MNVFLKEPTMSKHDLIKFICEINRTAKNDFLEKFSEDELSQYLDHLMQLDLEKLALCA
jgi:hypothetical protein